MNDTSLKAKIRNISKNKNISAQAVLQNYLMNRFLYRISMTEYKDKFVIKGGMLISSIIGIDHRSTMDIDTTLQNLPLTEESITAAMHEICDTEIDDDITFTFDNIEPIRDDDIYGGYRVSFYAKLGKINAPISMDVSTGDVITPGAELHIFKDMFDENSFFELYSYPLETILAEKVETVLSRGIDNTRPRDFYDIYILSQNAIDKKVFFDAFKATSKHRNSFDKISDYNSILSEIFNDKDMNTRWQAYSKLMSYANDIKFEDTIEKIRSILELKD